MAAKRKRVKAVLLQSAAAPVIEPSNVNITKKAIVDKNATSIANEVKRVSEDSRALREAFLKLGIPSKYVEELSFHLAEVSEELVEIAGLLRIICKHKTCSREQYGRLLSCVGVHWGYHLPRAKRILQQVEIAPRPQRRVRIIKSS